MSSISPPLYVYIHTSTVYLYIHTYSPGKWSHINNFFQFPGYVFWGNVFIYFLPWTYLSHLKIPQLVYLNSYKSFIKTNDFFLFFKFIYLFIFGGIGPLLLRTGFLWLRRVGATLCCRARASHCGGFSCPGAWALGAQGSVIVACGLSSCGLRALERRLSSVAHGLSCSAACVIFLDQGSNPCPLHWQVDSFFFFFF